MAKPTHDEIIRELTRDVAIVKVHLESLREETDGVPDLTVRLALLEQQVENMRQGWDRWGQRL